MFETFQITVTFCLGEREEDSTKGGVNSFGGEHQDERAKPMKVQSCKDMPG